MLLILSEFSYHNNFELGSAGAVVRQIRTFTSSCNTDMCEFVAPTGGMGVIANQTLEYRYHKRKG